MRRTIPGEAKQKAKEMLRNGAKCSDIAQETGVHVTTIRRWKRELGLTKPREELVDENYVLKLNDGEFERLTETARFYGFSVASQFIKSLINEKYYEAKDEIDRERLKKEYSRELKALKEKYAELFRKETE